MADQDFNINIRTLADLTGIKLTQIQLESLQKAAVEGNQKAIQALKQLADAQEQARGGDVGFTRSAAGIGTIIALVTGAINRWRAFNEEQDKMVESMIRTEEKMRALGESIIDMQDAAISLRRIGTEPLEQSFVRLQQEIIRLKTEQSLLNLPEQGEEWKKLNSELKVTESQLDRVTSAMQRQKDEAARKAQIAAKATEKELSAQREFVQSALDSSSMQAQAILRNEEAARRAHEKGDELSAARFQKTADRLKQSATAEQLEEYRQLRRTLPGPQAPRTVEQWRKEQQEATERFYEHMGPGAIQRWRDEQKRMTDEFYGKERGQEGKAAGSDIVGAIHELRDLWK